jgi:FkbM family methyltransferase
LIKHPVYVDLLLACDPALVSERIREAIVEGRYEWPGGARLLAVVRDGDRVLELGGGIGCIASLVSKNRRLESYDLVEANSALGPLIRASLAANQVDNVRIHHCVLTDEPELLEARAADFHFDEDFWASSLRQRPNKATRGTVPIESFSEWIRRIRPTVIHCDIEGAEDGQFVHSALEGVRAITVEIHDNVIGSAGRKRVFETLQARGFSAAPSASRAGVVAFERTRA